MFVRWLLSLLSVLTGLRAVGGGQRSGVGPPPARHVQPALWGGGVLRQCPPSHGQPKAGRLAAARRLHPVQPQLPTAEANGREVSAAKPAQRVVWLCPVPRLHTRWWRGPQQLLRSLPVTSSDVPHDVIITACLWERRRIATEHVLIWNRSFGSTPPGREDQKLHSPWFSVDQHHEV